MEATETKKSKGIAIFAWLMLIVGAVTWIDLLDVKTFFVMYQFLPRAVALTLYGYSAISVAVGIVAILGILRRKDSMRKVAVFINALDVLTGIPLFFCLPGMRQSCDEIARSMMSGQALWVFSVRDVGNAGFMAAVVTASGALILNMIFIWYFTRPKVKARFK